MVQAQVVLGLLKLTILKGEGNYFGKRIIYPVYYKSAHGSEKNGFVYNIDFILEV
jgi:hypothetical protein